MSIISVSKYHLSSLRLYSSCRGMTLIEILIVCALIAILALLSVPSFQEGMVRTRRARASSDMRTLAAGLEIYAIDFNGYPIVASQMADRYIYRMPVDPFSRQAGYSYINLDEYGFVAPAFQFICHRARLSASSWCIFSAGPDLDLLNTPAGLAPSYYRMFRDYDPTNGSTSLGNIHRTRNRPQGFGNDPYFYLWI